MRTTREFVFEALFVVSVAHLIYPDDLRPISFVMLCVSVVAAAATWRWWR